MEFKQENKNETEQAQRKAREETKAVFKQDKTPLVQLRAKLRTTIADLTKAETLTDPQTRTLWEEFQPPLEKGAAPPKPQEELASFQEFRKALAGKDNLDQLDQAVAEAFASLEQHGLLANPLEKLKGFNQKTIEVYSGR